MPWVWILIIAIIAIDQITKFAVRAAFSVGEGVPVLGDFFHITYVQNTGTAFSMFEGNRIATVVFPLILMAALLILLLFYMRDLKRAKDAGDSKSLSVKSLSVFSLAIALAGGLGNMIDRLTLGFVTDMFDFGFFPVFNVADVCITTGCFLVVISILLEWFGERKAE